MPPRPRLVLFDLDGVLADYDRPARCAALARACGADADTLFEAMFGDDGLEHASDRGEIGLRESLLGLRDRHGWVLDDAAFVDARRLSTRPRPEVLELCRALSAQARIAVFTNNGDWVGEHIASIFPELPALFGEAIVCSGQLRQWKPQPEAFHTCLARLGDIAPAQALFIDDNADNVEGARRAGLDALLYTDFAALRPGLRTRGFALDGDKDAP
jgi:HAD superfamily hydrolase (TIGR01509 family)